MDTHWSCYEYALKKKNKYWFFKILKPKILLSFIKNQQWKKIIPTPDSFIKENDNNNTSLTVPTSFKQKLKRT